MVRVYQAASLAAVSIPEAHVGHQRSVRWIVAIRTDDGGRTAHSPTDDAATPRRCPPGRLRGLYLIHKSHIAA